jgi:two-component system, NarL family, response regulator LiaR
MPLSALICDDHPTFARGLARLLEVEAPDISVVGVAATAIEAERQVRELLPDLVLMDLRLPGIDGIEATRRIRAASPTTKVMILTVSDEQADLYGALRAGAMGYVTKDKDVAEIANALRSVHRGHLVIPGDLAGHFLRDLETSDPALMLSSTERDILAAIGRGETNREMAGRLHMSERTVRRRVEDIYSKLHLADRLEAALYAAQRGIGRDVKEADNGR